MIVDSVIRHILNNIQNLKVLRYPSLIIIEYRDYWIFFAEHEGIYYRTTIGLFDYSSALLDLSDPNALTKPVDNLRAVIELIDIETRRA